MTQSLDDLFRQLSSGDLSVAGQVFLQFEPYLRKVLRRYLTPALRTRFDSSDILQSVWADVFDSFRDREWRFESPAQLRAFLTVALRNRVIQRVRRQRFERSCAGDPLQEETGPTQIAAPGPRPSELAVAQEMWEQLLALCPPEHQPVLTLKRQGYALAEIAAQTGLHPDSVRRILRTLARRLAFHGKPQDVQAAATAGIEQ